MSATIKSGATADLWTVDATSKAGRATLYKADGSLYYNTYAGIYRARIEIIPTTLTLGTTYFAMRNLGTRRCYIRVIDISIGFSGTAALTRGIYEIDRFSAATPTGGTTQTALKTRNTWPASSMTDIRFAPGGLTTTGVTFEAPFHLIGHTNQVTVDRDDRIAPPSDDEDFWMEIAVNEGLCIRANTALVAGTYLTGSIVWAERT
jgi:hypothetical protein